jgi:hypothetical protein
MDEIYGANKANTVETTLNIHFSDNFNVNFGTGLLREKKTFLGIEGEGIFAFEKNTFTNFFSAGSNYNKGNFSLFANYSLGISKPEFVTDAIFTDISNVYSDSFSAGGYYTLEGKIKSRVGATISQPLRITKGEMVYNVATARNYDDDSLTREEGKISLVPDSREIDLQTFYAVDETKFGDLKFAYMYKINPEHNSENANESIFMINLKNKF